MFRADLTPSIFGSSSLTVRNCMYRPAWMRKAGTILFASFAVVAFSNGGASSYVDWGPYPPVAPWTTSRLDHHWALVNMVFPLVGSCHWKNDYDVKRGSYRHTGIDIAAPKMTPIVAPFKGVIGMKKDSFWIYGTNGWALLGTHLNEDDPGTHDRRGGRDVMFAPDLAPGQTVESGQFIGYVGMSGNATGPHLHFELYAPGTGLTSARLRDPWPSLKRAQHISHPRIFIPQKEQKPESGLVRLQGCIRRVDPSVKKVTIILLAKQLPSGHVTPVDHLRYIRLRLSDTAVADAGGWERLNGLGENRSAAFYVPYARKLDGRTVDHVLLGPGA
jgi:murein DD-endopeptidase MepM/ murein hydrolase activator NlpD